VVALICIAILSQMSPDDAPLIGTPADAHASQEAFTAGLAAYAAKDYDAAIAYLSRSYGLVSRSDVLYAWAQAERLRGNCAAAVPLYERFTHDSANALESTRAHEQLERCRRLLPVPWYRDWVGHALTLSGVAGLTAGTAFFASSQAANDDARAATSYPAYASAWSRAHDDRRNAIVGWSVGGGLVVAGVGHYIWFALRQKPPPVAVSVMPGFISIAGEL
jgi:tetratricopeptide (TPR) repeat protein